MEPNKDNKNKEKKNEEEQIAGKRVFEISESQLEEIREQAKERMRQAQHTWRQRGGWVVCISCVNQHAIRIRPDSTFKGVENNVPIIERKE